MDDRTAIDICPACLEELSLPDGNYCPRCGAARGEFSSKCPNCYNMHPAMDRTSAFGFYEGRLREALVAYKFEGRADLARTLGTLAGLAARRMWPRAKFDCVVAVPLHRARRRERGFDQARELARFAAGVVGAPFEGRLLKRVRATESQMGLTRTARMRNVAGAFEARGQAPPLVLVVDDIMTTGATVSEASRTLKRAGAGRIFAAVVARSPLGEAGTAAGGAEASSAERTVT